MALYGAETWTLRATETPAKFCNVFWEKDGKNQSDRSCEE